MVMVDLLTCASCYGDPVVHPIKDIVKELMETLHSASLHSGLICQGGLNTNTELRL